MGEAGKRGTKRAFRSALNLFGGIVVSIGGRVLMEKNFRLRVIVGLILEERGIPSDSITAAELLRAEQLADAYLARVAPAQQEPPRQLVPKSS